jgi:hypothetical protein
VGDILLSERGEDSSWRYRIASEDASEEGVVDGRGGIGSGGRGLCGKISWWNSIRWMTTKAAPPF